MNNRDPRTRKPTFGASFLEHYESLGGARTTFTASQIETLRRADRSQALRLLRELRVFGGSDADVLLLYEIESPEVVAQMLLNRQKPASWFSLMTGALVGRLTRRSRT